MENVETYDEVKKLNVPEIVKKYEEKFGKKVDSKWNKDELIKNYLLDPEVEKTNQAAEYYKEVFGEMPGENLTNDEIAQKVNDEKKRLEDEEKEKEEKAKKDLENTVSEKAVSPIAPTPMTTNCPTGWTMTATATPFRRN